VKQVSPHYVIIGNGRMASHIAHYFDDLSITYHQWYRSAHNNAQLDEMLIHATHVLLLISDKAIETFIQEHQLNKHQHLMLIHFSGCLVSSYAYGAHPLQTFNQSMYASSEYPCIPFMIDEHAPDFSDLLPGLDNPHYRIPASDKAYYHAMCVLSNNVSTLLWQKFYQEMKTRFDVRHEDLHPFLQRTCQNIQSDPASALTGPIARKDRETLERDLKALQGDPFYSVLKNIIHQFALGEENEDSSGV